MDEVPVIRTEALSKRYGVLFWKKKRLSLDRLTISVPRGSVFGFLGPNGAGKTTTIKLLMDLMLAGKNIGNMFSQVKKLPLLH